MTSSSWSSSTGWDSSTGWSSTSWSPTWWSDSGGNYYDDVVSGWKYILRACHGGAMVMTWAVFTSTGLLVARYGRHKHWWIHVHRRMQTAGFLLSLPLTFLSFATKEGNTHYSVIHSQLGLTVSILSFCQGILGGLLFGAVGFGPCINFPVKVKKRVRLVAKFLHHWNGRFVVSLALTVIFLGIFQLNLPLGYQVSYGLYLGFGFLGVLSLEYRRQTNSPTPVKGAHKAADEDDKPTHYEEELIRQRAQSRPSSPISSSSQPPASPKTFVDGDPVKPFSVDS